MIAVRESSLSLERRILEREFGIENATPVKLLHSSSSWRFSLIKLYFDRPHKNFVISRRAIKLFNLLEVAANTQNFYTSCS
jgi:hypothetical protein